MQQEQEVLTSQQREANLEKLLTKVEKLGWAEMKPQVKESFEQGLQEFQCLGIRQFGDATMEVAFHFGPGKKEASSIYLDTMQALLTKPVQVPHTMIDKIDTQRVEDALRVLPKNEHGIIDPVALENVDAEKINSMNQAMRWAMDHAPEVFNALIVKYNPPLNPDIVPISAELRNQQEELQKSTVKYNSVSSYYNLSALELFNAMDGRFPLKKLFANKNEQTSGQQQGATASNRKQFEAYVVMDFSTRLPDGSSPIELIPANRLNIGKAMLEYNVAEMESRHNRPILISFLEKGSLVQFTNPTNTDEKHIRIFTNPRYGDMQLRRLDGSIIFDKKPYLKNPLNVHVGAVVSLQKEESPTHQQAPLEAQTTEQIASRFQVYRKMQATEQGQDGKGLSAAPWQSPAPSTTQPSRGDGAAEGIQPGVTQQGQQQGGPNEGHQAEHKNPGNNPKAEGEEVKKNDDSVKKELSQPEVKENQQNASQLKNTQETTHQQSGTKNQQTGKEEQVKLRNRKNNREMEEDPKQKLSM